MEILTLVQIAEREQPLAYGNWRDRMVRETSIWLAALVSLVNGVDAFSGLLLKLSIMTTTVQGPSPGSLLVGATLAHQT